MCPNKLAIFCCFPCSFKFNSLSETNIIAEDEREKEGKKVWQDKKEKWSHDRFNELEQTPKTKSELVGIYGYDIRNEDGPPRARRRRRYGRGPNKYTRNWEDEDAYNKPQPVVHRPKKSGKSKEDAEEFPPLVKDASPERPMKESSGKKEQEAQVKKSEERSDLPREKIVSQAPPPTERITSNTNNVQEQPSNKNNQRVGSGRVGKPAVVNGFTARTADNRKYNKPDQQKVMPSLDQPKGDYIQSQNFTNKKNLQELEQEMNKLSVDGVYRGSGNNRKRNDNNQRHGSAPPDNYNQRQGGAASNNGNNQRQGSVPPRLQSSEQKGSKRYSSMRQRSLPEANNPPLPPNYQHATSFYPSDYNQQPPPAVAQPLLHQNAQMLPTTTQVPQMPAPLQPIPAQPVPVTAAALLQAPFPHAFPQPPPAFLQPGVPTTPFIAPQPPQIINYVQGQAAFPPNFQSFPQQFNPVTPPTELYQPQGGITYYSTDQQPTQRQAPPKRPKAAIPIVAPPLNKKMGENASYQNEEVETREANDTADVQQ
ncbi:hypothetical protein JTB14_037995 [Gonioctena quinquepunctata]|nr:hypothetical protein JTB14_037995 [Gonioctena quinquepunctata]